MSEAALLQATRLRLGFGDGDSARVLLHDTSLHLGSGASGQGELVALLGPNGSGKSTLLRVLSGLARPLAGTVHLLGKALDEWPLKQRARQLALVLPGRFEAGSLKVWELVALGRLPHTGWWGQLGDGDRRAVSLAMERCRIGSLADREAASLSDGEHQRVALARALAQEPKILVLDEPTAFLDLVARQQGMHLLRRLADEGLTILVATHELDLAMALADRLWILQPDHSLAQGWPEDLGLSDSLERAFGTDPTAILAAEGSMPRFPVRVEASETARDQALPWLRRALRRHGYEATPPGEAGDGPSIHIDVGGRPGQWTFELRLPAASRAEPVRYESLQELVTALSVHRD